jgi:predicted transposase/invertase (TIGR01784 family)
MASKIVEEYGDERAAEALKIGIEQGQQKKAIEVAKNLYENGVSVEIIAKSLNMSEEKVREIIEQNVTVKA